MIFGFSYGGGIAYGYRVVTCKGWTWEAFAGYHYWAGPDYFTTEFKTGLKKMETITMIQPILKKAL